MPKKKKLWRSLQVDAPESSSVIANESLFFIDKGTTSNAKSQLSKKKAKDVASGSKKKLAKEVVQKPQSKRLKKSRQSKASDLWAETPSKPSDPWTDTTPKSEAKTSKKRKRPKLKPTKRVLNSVLSTPERFDLIGAHLTVADPGVSINPDPQAQQDFLRQAYDLDLKEKKERDQLLARFKRKPETGETPGDGEEANVEDNEAEADEEQDESEKRPLNTKVLSDRRKTQAQRNKKKRKIERLELEKRKGAQKALKKQLQKIPEVIKTIDEEEKENAADIERLKELKKHPDKPLRLGKNLIQKDFPEVLLTEEVAGGHYRNIQPSAKVIKDQFKRFQERNLIEPRTKNRLRRRYRLKEFEIFKEPGESKLKKPGESKLKK